MTSLSKAQSKKTLSPMNEPPPQEQTNVAANVSTKHTSRVTVALARLL